MAREAWTDERLDDLNGRVERGFDEIKGEVQDLRNETKAEFRELRAEMNTRFDSLQRSFDSLHRTLILGVIGMSATIVGALFVVQS